MADLARLGVQVELDSTDATAGAKALQTNIKQMEAAAERASVKFKKAEASSKRMGKSMGSSGRFAQQASVQFGDFLVQVGNGGGIMRAFAQQANQLGAFMAGPWGIAFTIATGVMAAFAGQMKSASKELNEYEKGIQQVANKTAELNAANELAASGQSKTIQFIETQLSVLRTLVALNEQQEKTGTNTIRLMGERIELLDKIRGLEADRAEFLEAERKSTELTQDNIRKQSVELLNQEVVYNALADISAVRLNTESQTAKVLREQSLIMNSLANNEMLPSQFDLASDLYEGALGDIDSSTRDLNKPAIGGGGGGGGKSPAQKAAEDMVRLNEEFQKAAKLAMDFSSTFEMAMVDVGGSALDSFIDGLVEGEFAFKDFARSVLQDLAKIMVKALVVTSLLRMAGISSSSNLGDLTGFQRVIAQIGGLNVTGLAKGGIVNGPTMLNATTMAGEAGPEAVMPLQRDSNGNLGVAGPAITINNYSGQDVRVTRSDNELIEIAVGQSRQAVAADYTQSMTSGQGPYAKALEGGYSSRRRAV